MVLLLPQLPHVTIPAQAASYLMQKSNFVHKSGDEVGSLTTGRACKNVCAGAAGQEGGGSRRAAAAASVTTTTSAAASVTLLPGARGVAQAVNQAVDEEEQQLLTVVLLPALEHGAHLQTKGV